MKLKLERAVTGLLALSPGATIPFGLGPWWLDAAGAVIGSALWHTARATRKPFWVSADASADHVYVRVNRRYGWSIPKDVAKNYYYSKTNLPSYWEGKHYYYNDGPSQPMSLVVMAIRADDTEVDEKLHAGVARGKECLNVLMNRGTEASQLAKRANKLLTK